MTPNVPAFDSTRLPLDGDEVYAEAYDEGNPKWIEGNGPKLSRIFDVDGICASRGHAFEK